MTDPQECRWALQIEYDGTAFHGFQRQPPEHGPTVQGCLEAAITEILGCPTPLVCAGRTDTGVHATGQVVHFDTRVERPERAWTRGLNSMCGPALRVQRARRVTADFHARFSALSRRYLYLLEDGGRRSPIGRRYLGYSRQPLDSVAMHQAAQVLWGPQDFAAFRAAGCQAHSSRRTLHHLRVRRVGALVVFDVQADGFLQHMVRNLVGSLLTIGNGSHGRDWLAQLLASRDRTLAPAAAAPQGLYLVQVTYPAAMGLDLPLLAPPLLGDAGPL